MLFAWLALLPAYAQSGPAPDPADGLGQFPAVNTRLAAWLDFSQFSAPATEGNDTWGYVSPSGREYGFIGLNSIVGVVEVTNPDAPVIVDEFPHPPSDWTDTRTYGDRAYFSNQTGGGVQILDLSDIDNGNVKELTPLTAGGLQFAHTLSIDELSGFLYTAGSNVGSGGLLAYSLANPDQPAPVGIWDDNYVHAVQVVTHASGPFAGMQIAYVCAGALGFQLVDVTDKANMHQISEVAYPTRTYTHQGWLDWDRQLYYLGDEGDEMTGSVASSTTYVFDVSDVFAPALVSTFTNGITTIDHNLQFRDGIVYEANYLSGLRIWNTRVDPYAPTEVGSLDTYPSVDEIAFAGAWGVYAQFPSHTVLVSDLQSGLFVVDVSDALAAAEPPATDTGDPTGGTTTTPPTDTTPPSTTSTTGSDTAPDDTLAQDDEKGGCGCETGAPGAGAGLALALTALATRRRSGSARTPTPARRSTGG